MGELGCSGRVSSDTRRVNLATNAVSSYDKIISTFVLFNAHDLSMKDNSISFVNTKGSTII
jgi:hypothetical protein